jgi:hypothetical protein
METTVRISPYPLKFPSNEYGLIQTDATNGIVVYSFFWRD